MADEAADERRAGIELLQGDEFVGLVRLGDRAGAADRRWRGRGPGSARPRSGRRRRGGRCRRSARGRAARPGRRLGMKPGSSMRVLEGDRGVGMDRRGSRPRAGRLGRARARRQAVGSSSGRQRTSPEKVQSRAVMLLAVPPCDQPDVDGGVGRVEVVGGRGPRRSRPSCRPASRPGRGGHDRRDAGVHQARVHLVAADAGAEAPAALLAGDDPHLGGLADDDRLRAAAARRASPRSAAGRRGSRSPRRS